MLKDIVTVVAVVAGLVATRAQAHDGSHGNEHSMLEEVFSRIDANTDGELSEQELQAHAARRFASVDANGDGALTPVEVAASMRGHQKDDLLKFDTDGNGALNADELYKIGESKKGKRASKRFDRLDANNSGDITLSEMQADHDLAKMFARADRDKSGGLSLDEFAKAQRHAKQKMK